MLSSARDIGARLRDQARPLEGQAVAAMVNHGLAIQQVPGDAIAAWEQGARACLPKIVPSMVPAAMVDKVLGFRDEYRAQHPDQ